MAGRLFSGIFLAGLAAALPAGEQAHRPRQLPSSSLSVTTSYESTIEPTQTATSPIKPSTKGTIHPDLGTSEQVPIVTNVPTEASSIEAATTTLDPTIVEPTSKATANVFVALANDAPPGQVPNRDGHPAPQTGIINPDGRPISTNKFYANLFLGSQTQPVWTHPYSLAWNKGGGQTKSWGLAVAHIEASQYAFGPGEPAEFFTCPLGIQSFVISAAELGDSTRLTTDSHTGFSANANLAPGEGKLISFPLVQGMGFVSAIYSGASPRLQTSIGFRELVLAGPVAGGKTFKYRVALEDDTKWLLYLTPTGSTGAPPLNLANGGVIEGPSNFDGLLQLAKNPAGDGGESAYDGSAGAFATGATLSGTVDGGSGSYSISWQKGGDTGKKLLMFALPHHVESFDGPTSDAKVGINLQTTTKGTATAIVADSMTLVEGELPVNIGFAPVLYDGGYAEYSADAIAAIVRAASSELGQDIPAQTNLNSMYYSGKGLAKFAQIVFAANDIAKNSELAAAGLQRLKDAFATFVNNQQQVPLVYDTVWKGVVSRGSYDTGDSGVDFGNTFYNDHHFHYGYFVYTAAIIGYLDNAWLGQGSSRAWVDMLVRDFANPATDDPFFPQSRAFDWYHGHSWAKGLFESGDGKDQESTSEDGMASYGLKMWGRVTGDANLEARANLMLAAQRRAFRSYFLMEESNTVQPARFIGNKVTGILFENKIHHTTYFGANIEYIQGIHMIPVNPSSVYTRSQNFVREEWAAWFAASGPAMPPSGWKGILYANLALAEPRAAYAFFADAGFSAANLDGGASLTWYLTMSAGLGGS